jgi:hypothetical protein
MTGPVCYIDLLGFSYLTDRSDDINIKAIIERYVSYLHNIIYKVIEGTNINVSVISDAVFLYTENKCDQLIFSLPQIFRQCITNGILLRAGLSYGEFSITTTELSANNIYGEAVTRAVKLEKSGKGCRIFMDQNIPVQCSDIFLFNQEIFKQYRNYADYSYIDVFEWPLIYGNYYYSPSCSYNIDLEPNKDLADLIFDDYKLSIYLRFSPYFSWNMQTVEGFTHVAVSIEYITSLIDLMMKKTKNARISRIEQKYNIKLNAINREEVLADEYLPVDQLMKDNNRNDEIVENMIGYGRRKYLNY